MTNRIFMNIAFAFMLSVTPFTSGMLHAETPIQTTTAAKAKKPPSLKAVFASLALIWGSLVAHEGGHALAASLLKAGSVKKFYVGLTGGYVMFDPTGLSSLAKIAIFAAGPLAGFLFSYTAAKTTDVIDEYQRNKNLMAAMATAWKKPLYTDPKGDDLKAVKHATRRDMLLESINIFAFDFPRFLSPGGVVGASDGKQILKALEFSGDSSHWFQPSPGRVLLWNASLVAGIYAAQCWLDRAARLYEKQESCEDLSKVEIATP